MSNIATAVELAAQGLRVFPQDRNKRPHIREWPERATTDEDIIRKWGTKLFPACNFAAATGRESDIVVLDVDVKNGQPGRESLERLKSEHGELETLTVQTPSGGWHYYYRYPADLEVRNHNLRDYAGIEVKADGGCVTLPDSFYTDGRRYTLLRPGPIAEPPEWLCELLRNGTKSNGSAAVVRPTTETIIEGERNSHLTSLAGKLRRVGQEFEVIRAALLAENEKCTPPLPEGEVDEIARSVSRYDATDPLLALRKTDTGTIERFIQLVKGGAAYCAVHDRWYIYDGRRWKVDDAEQIVHLGRKMVEHLYGVGQQIKDDADRANFLKYVAGHADKAARITSTITLARSDPALAIRPAQLDAKPWLFNTASGTVDVRDGTIREHRSEDYLTQISDIAFDPGAQCPRWLQFLEEIFPGDDFIKLFLQQAIGYTMSGSTREQCFFLLVGNGSNGKSSTINLITDLLGDYALHAEPETFMERAKGHIPNDVARLYNARFVCTIETAKNQRLAENRIKALAGEDRVTARFLHAENFEFDPQFKVWISTNNAPEIRDTKEGMWRKIRRVPFNVDIPVEKRDGDLREKLRQELPGILQWALTGCRDWYKNKLIAAPAVTEATKAYRVDSDILSDFISEHFVIDRAATATASEVYRIYTNWAAENGERCLSQTKLGRELGERHYHKEHRRDGAVYLGLGIK